MNIAAEMCVLTLACAEWMSSSFFQESTNYICGEASTMYGNSIKFTQTGVLDKLQHIFAQNSCNLLLSVKRYQHWSLRPSGPLQVLGNSSSSACHMQHASLLEPLIVFFVMIRKCANKYCNNFEGQPAYMCQGPGFRTPPPEWYGPPPATTVSGEIRTFPLRRWLNVSVSEW